MNFLLSNPRFNYKDIGIRTKFFVKFKKICHTYNRYTIKEKKEQIEK